MIDYCLVYSIQPYTIEGQVIYIPDVCIANVKNGIPQYYYKKATPEILLSTRIEPDVMDSSLILICKENSIEAIEQRYNKNKKKFKNIIDLFKEEETKISILARLNRDNAHFLQKLSDKSDAKLYYDIQRKIFLPDIAITLPIYPFDVKIKLDKTITGLNYGLKLIIDGKEILPSEVHLIILTDQPCNILVGNQLYANSNFYGKRLIPFLSKNVIFVPQQTIPVYFNKFIKDIVRTVEVEATGFDFDVRSFKPKLELKFTENLISSYLELSCYVVYGETKFRLEDSTNNKVLVEVDEDGIPKVSKTVRDRKEEEAILNKIFELGFYLNEHKKLMHTDFNEKFGILYAVIEYLDELENAEIDLIQYTLNGVNVNTNKYSLTVSYEKQGDWFDIKAILKIGEFEVPFTGLIKHIKNENRYFVLPDGEIFIIPEEWMNKYSMLAKFGKTEGGRFIVSKAHFTVIEGLGERKEVKKTNEELPIILPSGLKADLRDYQKEGAIWLIGHYTQGLGACLADDMGLGKTLQTIALLQYIKENHIQKNSSKNSTVQLSLFDDYANYRNTLRALVVLPASLVFNWEAELKKFAPQLMIKRFVGAGRATNHHELEYFDVIITTYQTAQRDEKLLQKLDFRVIILDESHYIKNKDTKVFKSLSQLKAYQRITLSGTPVENSLSDLWAQMQFINPDILGEYTFFNTHFKIPIEKEKNKDRVEELKSLIMPFLLRRTKDEVLKDLPPLMEQFIYSEMGEEQYKCYETEKSAVRNQILDLSENNNFNKINVLNALMRLRQLCNHPAMLNLNHPSSKFEDVKEYLHNLLKAGHNVLIFSVFVKHLNIYETYLKEQKIEYAMLTGELDENGRKKEVERFMNKDNCRIFLMSLKAGGVGLNLTKASYVIILDPWWNPFTERQAIARAHRLGQENKVTVLRFITKDSIEEKILQLQKGKLELASEFVDVGDFPDLDQQNIEFLID